jgi:hypothetical protein
MKVAIDTTIAISQGLVPGAEAPPDPDADVVLVIGLYSYSWFAALHRERPSLTSGETLRSQPTPLDRAGMFPAALEKPVVRRM